jgi:hypothetical protein
MLAIILLIPVGCYNLFGFVDTAFHLGIFIDHELPVVITESSSESSVDAESAYTESADISIDESSDSTSKKEKSEKDIKREKFLIISEAIFNAIFIFGSLCFHYFFYQSARKLCVNTQSVKMGFKANRNMAINIIFFSVWGLLTAGGASMAALNVVTILHFAVLILNFLYIY